MNVFRTALSLSFGENIYANEVEEMRPFVNIIERRF